MLARYANLSQNATVFKGMTGLKLNEFNLLVLEVKPLLVAERQGRLEHPGRKRGLGGGLKPQLNERDQILLSVIWLRVYPTNETLGYLFGVSDSTVSRIIGRVVPLLAHNGTDTMRMSDPRRKHRRNLGELVEQVPQLSVVVDSFEQRVQRHRDRTTADTYYSGKKKQNTLKSQLAVDAITGVIMHVSESVLGPTSDTALLAQSGLLEQLPSGHRVGGDLAYVGIATLIEKSGRSTQLEGHTPRRKPREKARPVEDIAYNTAFSRQRIIVEHSIGRVRCYHSLTQMDRHHRKLHTERVQAVVGLANRQLESRVTLYRRRVAVA
jgi:hypothetical protein